jgi:hypothetical protein
MTALCAFETFGSARMMPLQAERDRAAIRDDSDGSLLV